MNAMARCAARGIKQKPLEFQDDWAIVMELCDWGFSRSCVQANHGLSAAASEYCARSKDSKLREIRKQYIKIISFCRP